MIYKIQSIIKRTAFYDQNTATCVVIQNFINTLIDKK